MKKKIGIKVVLTAIAVLLIGTLLTGCMRFKTTIKVTEDGKADLSMLVAMSEELSNFGSEDDEDSDSELTSEETKKEFEDEGWTYAEYNEDGYKGYVVTKSDILLDELASTIASDDAGVDTNTDSLNITKNDNGEYTISWDVLGSDDADSMGEYQQYIEEYKGFFLVTIELPKKPISNNATEVSEDGKTLTWDVFKMNKGDKVEVTFKLPSDEAKGGNTLFIIIAVIAIIAIVVAVVCIVLSKNKKAPVNNEVPSQPVDSVNTTTADTNGDNTSDTNQ